MKEAGLREPLFISEKGLFKVIFYNNDNNFEKTLPNLLENKIYEFCKIPRTKNEIAQFLNKTQYYVVKTYIDPMIAQGKLAYTLPNKPKSKLQKVYSV